MQILRIPFVNPKGYRYFVDLVSQTMVARSKMANPPHDILDILLRTRANTMENAFNDSEKEFGNIPYLINTVP